MSTSIHHEQPEHTHEDLDGRRAVERIQRAVEKARTCFLCTTVATNDTGGVRPMNVRQVDDFGNLWFLSASDSSLNRELELDPRVKLYLQGSPHSDFLHLTGRAEVSRDAERIRALWEPLLRTWFTGGVDDPRITVIKVVPDAGYYWDNKHGNFVAGAKMMLGAMIGKTLDDSIQGAVRVSEAEHEGTTTRPRTSAER